MAETSLQIGAEQIQPLLRRDLSLKPERHPYQTAQHRTQAKTTRDLVMQRGRLRLQEYGEQAHHCR